MKIVLITDLYLPNVGGVETVVYHLAREFTNTGNKVTVIAARTPRSLPSFEVINGIDVYRLDFVLPALKIRSILGFFTLGFISNMKLVWLLNKIKPDVVNTHFIYANGFYTLISKKFLKYPLIISTHGNDVQLFPHESKIVLWILKDLLRNADLVTGCSASLLNETKLIIPEISKRSHPMPNGIDLQEFEINEKYLHSKPYIFSIGRFVNKKGFDILIKAFKHVAENKQDIELIIAGTGEELEKCVCLVEELGLKERVKLPGFVERKEAIRLYKGCEFFVLPSRREPFGITNLEAMAAGKAVIAADVDGVSEIVENGENGLLFKQENINELAEKMLFLLDNREIKEAQGRSGRLLVEKKYAWQSIAENYIKNYETILRR